MTAFHYKSVQGQMWSEILALLAFVLELSFILLYNIFSTSPGSGTFIFKGKKSSKVILKQELNQQSTYFALKWDLQAYLLSVHSTINKKGVFLKCKTKQWHKKANTKK